MTRSIFGISLRLSLLSLSHYLACHGGMAMNIATCFLLSFICHLFVSHINFKMQDCFKNVYRDLVFSYFLMKT